MTRKARLHPWEQAEDRLLLSIVSEQGTNSWKQIAQTLRTRSAKQCRERFHNSLDPSLRHEPITPGEGEVIEHLVAEMGKKWARIARQLNGRSHNAVKNWWYGAQNKRKQISRRHRRRLENSQTYYLDRSRCENQQLLSSCQTEQHHWHQQHQRQSCLVLPSIQTYLATTSAKDTPISSVYGPISTENALSLKFDCGLQPWPFHHQRSPVENTYSPSPGRHSERRFFTPAEVLDDGSFLADDDGLQIQISRALSTDYDDAGARECGQSNLSVYPTSVSDGLQHTFYAPGCESIGKRWPTPRGSISRRPSPVQLLPDRRSHCLIRKSLPSFGDVVQSIAQRMTAKLEPTPVLPPIKLDKSR